MAQDLLERPTEVLTSTGSGDGGIPIDVQTTFEQFDPDDFNERLERWSREVDNTVIVLGASKNALDRREGVSRHPSARRVGSAAVHFYGY